MESKKVDYSGYGYKGQKRTHGHIGKSLLLASVVGLLLVVIVFIVVAQSAGQSKIALLGKTCFAVSLGSFESEKTAQLFALTVKNRGGAGFVHLNKKYHVLAVLFTDKESAQSVVDKINKGNDKAEVLEISSRSKHILFAGTKTETDLFRFGLNLFWETFLELSKMSLDFDNKVVSTAEVFNSLSNISEKIIKTHEELSKLTGGESKPNLTMLLEDLSEFNKLIFEAMSSVASSSELKFTAISAFTFLGNVAQ